MAFAGLSVALVHLASNELSNPIVAEVISSEAIVAAGNGSLVAPARGPKVANQSAPKVYWALTAHADMWVAFGAVPAPGASPRFPLKSGDVRYFEAVEGDKVGFAAA